VPKAFAPPFLEGYVWFYRHDMFNPDFTYSGLVLLSVKLDFAASRLLPDEADKKQQNYCANDRRNQRNINAWPFILLAPK
jgi:hypothetical protein